MIIWGGTKFQKRGCEGNDRVVYEDITEVPFWSGRVVKVSEGC